MVTLDHDGSVVATISPAPPGYCLVRSIAAAAS
jgi:hypothetical protein